jgi:cytochrome c peroxidase
MHLSVSTTTGQLALLSVCLIPGIAALQANKATVNLPKQRYSKDVVALGRALFRDKSLSNPPGMACISCHDPSTGFTFPDSDVNKAHGMAPGSVSGRFGNRKPPSVAYTPFMAPGIPHYDKDAIAWVGGLFWDGRAKNAFEQVQFPLFNPNEMNNQVHNVGAPESVAKKLKSGPLAALFKRAYGKKVFSLPPKQLFEKVAEAIVAYEASPEVSPFTSKYDAYLEGKADLTPQELLGLRLTTGTLSGRPNSLPFKKSAHCMDCHGGSSDLRVGPDLWTNSCYANLGVPRNDASPYFTMTDSKQNPDGYNADGSAYIDLGLAGFIYPYYGWTPRKPHGSDPLRLIGTFKAPTLRNVDKRPSPDFVKSYMHNGYFKSLKDVVHFYNMRNRTDVPGELIDYTKPDPYASLKGKPVFPPPEYLDATTLINPTGLSALVGAPAAVANNPMDPDAMQIGNLNLTEKDEEAIVAFLKCLTDGYFKR